MGDQPQPEIKPEVPVVPAFTTTPTPSSTQTAGTTLTPSLTGTPKPTSRQPVKERWIVTRKSQTKETNPTVSVAPALPTTLTPIPSLITPPKPRTKNKCQLKTNVNQKQMSTKN